MAKMEAVIHVVWQPLERATDSCLGALAKCSKRAATTHHDELKAPSDPRQALHKLSRDIEGNCAETASQL